MLYVSHIPEVGKIAVMDTDDGVETVIGFSELVESIEQYNIEVTGMSRVSSGSSAGQQWSIRPYQDPATCTIQQVKLRTIYDIDIRVYNDEITYLSVGNKDATIRLSDFGHRINLSLALQCNGNGEVTFIFDDSLSVLMEESCVGWKGFIFDVREVTRKDILYEIYADLIADSSEDCDMWPDYLIDVDDRLALCQCLCLLGKWGDDNGEYIEEVLSGRDRAAMGVRLVDNMRERLEEICTDNCITSNHSIGLVRHIMPYLEIDWDLSNPGSDFQTLRTRLKDFYNTSIVFDMPDWNTINRLIRYFDFFEETQEMRNYLVRYFHHLCKCVLKYCEEAGVEL